MGERSAQVDAYIRDAAPFARPVLERVREIVHAACPGVAETIKWGFPFFVHHGNLAYMNAFKAHCGFGLWAHRRLVKTPAFAAVMPGGSSGSFGRIASVKDLPSKRMLVAIVKAAVAINAGGAKGAAKPKRVPAPKCAAKRAAPGERVANAKRRRPAGRAQPSRAATPRAR